VEASADRDELREMERRQVRDGLESGAWDAEEQVAYLLRIFAPLGVRDESELVVDEIAHDLDHAHDVAVRMQRDGLALPPVVHSKLNKVDALLKEWSGPDKGDFWEPSGLRAHPVWQQVRSLCREAIVAIDGDGE
jgi:hypothetical protein